MGLLDLPPDVLDRIWSSLSSLCLAAVRLVCRALRGTGLAGRRHVILKLGVKYSTVVSRRYDGGHMVQNWGVRYSTVVAATPHVLRSAHTFESQLCRLD